MAPRLGRLLRYGLAIFSVGVATGIGLLLQYFHFHVPGVLVLFAVAITSWYAGLRPAVLAAVLAIVLWYWYFVEPVRTIYILPSEIPFFVIFVGFAGLLAWFGAVRRRIEADLREQADLLNLSHDAIFAMDMDGVIKYWNRGAEEQYGWTAEQAMGRVVHNLLKTIAPAPLEQVKAEVTRTGHWKGELVHARKDGTQVVVASSWSLQRDQGGTPVAILETSNDITERKRAEEALRHSNAYNRSLIEASLDPLVTVGPDGRITDVNASTEAATGRSRGELIGTDFCEYFTEPAEARAGYEQVFREGTVRDYPLKLRHRDGQVMSVLYNASVYRDESGGVIGVFAAARDITERKRAEEQLRQSEQLWRAVFSAAKDGVLLLDEQYIVVACNDTAEVIYGSSPLGKNLRELRAPETVAQLDAQMSQAKEEGGARWESVHLRADGSRFPIEGSSCSFEANGRRQFVSIVRDITGRKQEEETLRRLNRELRAISNCNQTLLRATDEQSLIEQICRIACDEAGYRMAWVGYAQDDEAKSVRPVAWAGFEDGYLARVDISWSEDSERGRGPSGTAIRSGKTCYIQDLMTDVAVAPWREGALQRGYRSIIALPLKGEDARIFGTLTIYSTEPNAFTEEEIRLLEELAGDLAFGIVTLRTRIERARAEKEQARLRQHLQQAQKMEAVGQLAGGVAHDFNNILGIINGYSEILLSGGDLKEAQRAPIEEILAAGQRAASLTRQLLAFSHKLVLQPKVLSLNSVIEGFEKMLRRLIGDEIEVRITLAPNLNAVSADPNQMEQVLLNFCINARDAMPEGGRITIETANLELDEAVTTHHLKDHAGDFFCPVCGEKLQPGRYVTLSVSDTGIGMNQETMSHIFEPFFTTKAPEHGTGLGLATVYGIVKQSGGHVSAYSEPGQGTTFRVYLPAVGQEIKGRERITAPQEFLRGTETVLLVEDAAPLRALYHKILEDRGYTVLEAEDGERAIQVAERYQSEIALLLTDVSLPKIKGPNLAKILLQQRPTMKVLFMSGHSDEAVSGPDRLLPTGTSFLQKPFGAEQLFRRMREILDPQQPEMVA
jgi:PAS domain S-box-containing protein